MDKTIKMRDNIFRLIGYYYYRMALFKNSLSEMLCLDLFLSTISTAQYKSLKPFLVSAAPILPLMSLGLDYNFIPNSNLNTDVLRLKQFQKDFQWDIDFDTLLNTTYDALVITDSSQSIFWVNNGFSAMTGYNSEEVVGRSPKFLQGKKTTLRSRNAIRRKIKNGEIITTKLINYRKNKEEYFCEVTIIPIKNKNQERTHFIALERELVY